MTDLHPSGEHAGQPMADPSRPGPLAGESVTDLLRAVLLAGQNVAVVGAGELGEEAAQACEALGAEVARVRPEGAGDDLAARLPAPLHTLVVDAAGVFAAAPQDGLAPLRAATDTAWLAARAAGTAAMIEAPEGGKIAVLAPRPGSGPHAQATRDALENFSRTLSIEWSRHGIRVVTIHPGTTTPAADVGALVAYLASPAGDYFSGCVLALGG